jgi:hypothetical protein
MPFAFRLKYSNFEGDGEQDVDDWLDHFKATLAANDEADVDIKKRLFYGLLRGEALRWYNTLEPAVKTNWDELHRAFVTEFKTEGTDHKVQEQIGELRNAVQRHTKGICTEGAEDS